MISISRIICPYDMTPISEHALQYAIKLINLLGGTIILVHAIETPVLSEPLAADYITHLTDKLDEDAKANMDKKIKELSDSFTFIQFRHKIIHTNDPADAIMEVVNDENPDVIVMGSHGRKGLSRILMGSVAESVMRLSKIPVMVIKSAQ